VSEEDDAEYRRRIINALNRHGFSWVVAQAEAQIAEGKPSAKQVSEREAVPFAQDPLFEIRRPRSRRASLITSEPYSERERLEIILQAIEAAVLQRALIENEIIESIHDVSAIHFEPENPVETTEAFPLGRPHVITPDRRALAIELAAQTRGVLAIIREREDGRA
jgi:hypothetical protein